MELFIDNRQEEIQVDMGIKDLLEKVVVTCLEEDGESLEYEVSLSLVTEEEIQRLNRDFRNKDKITDVLSFPMEEYDPIEGQLPLLGDIVICAKVAQGQADDFGHSLERELAYLTAHSMFHLMGYDHMAVDEKTVMREKEKSVMNTLGIFKQN